jgi:hypothetical protein
MNVNQYTHGLRSRVVRLAAAALCAAIVAGCSAVPLRSLWQLRQLDFWTLDANQVHALVLLPPGVAASTEPLRVTLKAQRGGDSGEAAQEVLVLRPRGTAAPTPEQRNSEQALPGSHWVALGFDEADVRRFDALRQRMQGWKASDGKVSGRSMSLEVAPALCASARGNAPAADKVRVSAWLRWKPGQEPVQVLDGAGLKDLKDDVAPQLPACA